MQEVPLKELIVRVSEVIIRVKLLTFKMTPR